MVVSISEQKWQISPKNIRTYILDNKITWHLPYFLQLIYFNIHKNYVIDNVGLTQEGIDRAFSQLCNQNQLDTWDERLKYYGDMEKTARRILNHVCQLDSKGASRDVLIPLIHNLYQENIDDTELALSRVIKMLANDGYLARNDQINLSLDLL